MFQTQVTISHREPMKTSCLKLFALSLTHFGPKNHTFIEFYDQQVLVADRFFFVARPSSLALVSHKNSKLIFFSANFVCIN